MDASKAGTAGDSERKRLIREYELRLIALKAGATPAEVASIKGLGLSEFADAFLSLPESAKREVLGYAKCLHATATSRARA